jgi:hypothetical protein
LPFYTDKIAYFIKIWFSLAIAKIFQRSPPKNRENQHTAEAEATIPKVSALSY